MRRNAERSLYGSFPSYQAIVSGARALCELLGLAASLVLLAAGSAFSACRGHGACFPALMHYQLMHLKFHWLSLNPRFGGSLEGNHLCFQVDKEKHGGGGFF